MSRHLPNNPLTEQGVTRWEQAVAVRLPGSTESEPAWNVAPPTTRPLLGMDSLAGMRYGSRLKPMVVIGYLGCRRHGVAKSRIVHYWLVRCHCGRYEARRNDTLRTKQAPPLCKRCGDERWARIQRGEEMP